jgi:hypothetical protein
MNKMIGGGSAQNDSVGFGKINGRRQKRNKDYMEEKYKD